MIVLYCVFLYLGTRWQLVEIENILKIVHVVPMFEKLDDSMITFFSIT